MSGIVNDGMDKNSMMEDRIEKTVDIYISAEAVRDMKHKREVEDFDTTETQTPQHTESDSVKIRSSRASPVCLVLLCVLLLTAVIVLSVMFTQERQQNGNLTNERDQLISKNGNLTNERDQLIFKNENLTNERDQLIFKNTNLTIKRDQLRNELQIRDKWIHYQSSFYYMPNETKNWTESRRYCTERGADLVIINNREEQDFVKNMSGSVKVWIGLTDSDVEGRWKWVDGTNMTSGFWASREPGEGINYPGGSNRENCVASVAELKYLNWPVLVGWLDEACNKAFHWICEKNISQLIMP